MIRIKRDERKQAFGDRDLGRSKIPLGDHFDAHAHRRAPDALDVGEYRNQVAQVNGLKELHRFDRDGCDRPFGPA